MDPDAVLNSQPMQAWTIYISFFTVFLGVNVTAIGLVVTRTDRGAARFVIGITFVIQNLISVITGMAMADYTRVVTNAFTGSNATALAAFQDLGVVGAYGNAFGNGVIGITWVVVMFVPGSARSRGRGRADDDEIETIAECAVG